MSTTRLLKTRLRTMAGSMTTALVFSSIACAYAADLALGPSGEPGPSCPSGTTNECDVAACQALAGTAAPLGSAISIFGVFVSSYSISDSPLCCLTYNQAGDGRLFFNAHPSPGSAYSAYESQVCKPDPQASMTGDPIVSINGHRIKFELPSAKKSLMWKDHVIDVLAAAELVTPDRKNQWFSDFFLYANDVEVAHVARQRTEPNDYNYSLSLAVFEHDVESTQAKLGTYNLGKGAYRVEFQRVAQKTGHVKRDVVKVTASSISFSLLPERAKKFSDEKLALKYAHLDLHIHNMQSYAKAGIIAELYGFVPLSAETAKLIKKVKM